MRFDFRQHDDEFFHVETGQWAGRVIPLKHGNGFSVHRALTSGYERDKVGVVKSMEEALPTLTDYYEKNWPQWKRTREGQFERDAGYTLYTAYIKWSFYGVFTAKRQEDRQWVATRCTDALLHDGKEATFPSAEVARHAVDLHERDGVAHFPALDDGYTWEPRRLTPVEQPIQPGGWRAQQGKTLLPLDHRAAPTGVDVECGSRRLAYPRHRLRPPLILDRFIRPAAGAPATAAHRARGCRDGDRVSPVSFLDHSLRNPHRRVFCRKQSL
jgi:hypothetical protein